MSSAETTDVGLAWHRTWVADRPAIYGHAGTGLPVLFLHGWGTGHRTYRAAIDRLVDLGCEVWAPNLPGFGGTAALPRELFSIAGFADWVERFSEAVGIEEPAVVIGHSFGGGVSIKVAHDHPHLVRSLVLVDSVGGARWNDGNRLRALAERPLWDWGIHFPGDVWPIPQATRVLPAVLGEAIPNIVRDPQAFWRVANLARRVDLTRELEELRARRVPVFVLWGRRDKVVPEESFDALCRAVGAEGAVVDGSHSWLLADPDHFGECITDAVEVAQAARELESRSRRRYPRLLRSLAG